MSLRLPPPTSPLTDGTISLRPPNAGDVPILEQYATRSGALDGLWLPVHTGALREQLRPLVDDWLRGWGGNESHNGPALVADIAGTTGFVGQVGFQAGDDSVELVYGVAPQWRGRGIATRAVILVTRWLVEQRGVRSVELRIARDARASQRVAEKAGFRRAGTVRQTLPATGATYEDHRYLYSGAGPSESG